MVSLLTLVIFSFLLLKEQPEPYLFSNQIHENLVNDTVNFKYEKAAWDYSFIGEYQKALWSYDQSAREYPGLTREQELYFLSFKPVNAEQYILKRAENEQVIIINEAHHQPMHRVFATSLLQGLYDRGYRYLGMEALNYFDTLLNKRGYPIDDSGYYSNEPQYGNLIRKALAIGYQIFPYEADFTVNGKEREIQQAHNIQKVINAHPDGKFLIYCGFAHINENEVAVWEKAMAGRLTEYTGINPFTVNQVILTEHFLSNKENPFFTLVDTLQHSSLFIHEDGSIFHGLDGDNRFDVRLYHPRTHYINGRPDWLLLDGSRHYYLVDQNEITIEYPVLIRAFLENESNNAVPVDVIEIKDIADQKALVLPKGNYRLVMNNTKGMIKEWMITVE